MQADGRVLRQPAVVAACASSRRQGTIGSVSHLKVTRGITPLLRVAFVQFKPSGFTSSKLMQQAFRSGKAATQAAQRLVPAAQHGRGYTYAFSDISRDAGRCTRAYAAVHVTQERTSGTAEAPRAPIRIDVRQAVLAGVSQTAPDAPTARNSSAQDGGATAVPRQPRIKDGVRLGWQVDGMAWPGLHAPPALSPLAPAPRSCALQHGLLMRSPRFGEQLDCSLRGC